MEYSIEEESVLSFLTLICKEGYQKYLGDKAEQIAEKTAEDYKKIVIRTESIGEKNGLKGVFLFSVYFMAMNQNTGLSAEENYTILEHALEMSEAYKKQCGDKDSYFDEKKTAGRKQWDLKSHERKYKLDWVVNYIDKKDDFEFGYDFVECGICKLYRQENCFELAKYLCRLDYLTMSLMGITLHRSQTIANGGDHCDFRFCK